MSKSILLVEDNPDDEALTLRVLRKHQIVDNIVVAHDGAEALDYLFGTGSYQGRDVADLPAVVLLDLKLPKIDGLQVLERIRSDPRTGLLPVVVLTSSDNDRDQIESYNLRVNSYVHKPVDFAEAVRQLGLYWVLLNEPPVPKTAPQDA
jgi:CheY-like chemotaxis protein